MRVFYTASFYGKSKYQSNYDLVLSALEQTGVTIISPEKQNYQSVLSPQEVKRFKTKNRIHYEAIKKDIQLADAVVIEMSYQDFQIGFEAALAVQNKKPLLCLSIYEDFSEKIHHRYFHAAQYSAVTIDNLVHDFIAQAKKNLLNQRFNFFLSPTQLQYLESTAKQQSLNTSEFLRHLIDLSRLKK